MTNNVFDQLSGIHDGPDGLGFLKKLKKGIKSAVKSIKKVRSKIAHKILPNSVIKLGKKVDKAGLTKIAAGVALAFVGGPAIMAGLKGAGGIAASAAGKAGALIKGGVAAAKTASGVVATVSQIKGGAGGDADAAQAEALRQAQISAEVAKAAGANQAFQQAVAQLRSQGYSDEEILNHWIESRTYYEQAVEAATRAVYPQAVQQYQAAGYPNDMAIAYGAQDALNIAETEVKQVQNQASGGGLLIPAGIILALLMGG